MAKQIKERLSNVQAGPLFTAETGTVLTAAHVGRYLLVRREKLPIGKFTTHDLRRTAATMLVEMGIALDLVAAIVGHEGGGKETRTLVRHYVRTDLIERKVHVLRAWDERLQGIDALIRMGFLKEDQRQDPKALQKAILGLLYRAEEDLA